MRLKRENGPFRFRTGDRLGPVSRWGRDISGAGSVGFERTVGFDCLKARLGMYLFLFIYFILYCFGKVGAIVGMNG